MQVRYAGAILVIAGCGGVGFCMAAAYRREEHLLGQLRDILQFMYCELQFHMTALPELCRKAGKSAGGTLGAAFLHLADRLDSCSWPDVPGCMDAVTAELDISPRLRELMDKLGRSLGCFDLEGQLKGLENMQELCAQELDALTVGREDRLRSYQTLGLCAGAALVILFV